MALGDHAISIYKQQKRQVYKTTANYKTWIADNTGKDVCYVGRKRAEKNISMTNKRGEVRGSVRTYRLPCSFDPA